MRSMLLLAQLDRIYVYKTGFIILALASSQSAESIAMIAGDLLPVGLVEVFKVVWALDCRHAQRLLHLALNTIQTTFAIIEHDRRNFY